jgi:hypothetical protein
MLSDKWDHGQQIQTFSTFAYQMLEFDSLFYIDVDVAKYSTPIQCHVKKVLGIQIMEMEMEEHSDVQVPDFLLTLQIVATTFSVMQIYKHNVFNVQLAHFSIPQTDIVLLECVNRNFQNFICN